MAIKGKWWVFHKQHIWENNLSRDLRYFLLGGILTQGLGPTALEGHREHK